VQSSASDLMIPEGEHRIAYAALPRGRTKEVEACW
jgi:hypothetical protein